MLSVAAGILAFAAFRTMAHARTHVNPYQPTTTIVHHRAVSASAANPILPVADAALPGATLLFNALWPLFLLMPLLAVMHRGVIAREERYLDGKFGDEYRQYRARVRRWL